MVDPAVLAQISLLAELTDAERTALAPGLRRRRYARGQVIFVTGDPGTGLYLVERGRVKLLRASAEGRELVLRVAGPGEVFGELALLDDEPRSADAVALEPCQLLLLAAADFRRFLDGQPGVARRLLALLSRRLRATTRQAEEAAFLGVPARLARLLVTLAEAEADGPPGAAGVTLGARLTQAELAALIGATRESVNRCLGDYERRGLVRRDGGRLTVLRPEALREELGELE
jgi:CRP-like cAMP-binding protein